MFDATITALQKMLDLRMQSQELHTSNVANANVPNYKARSLDFEARLDEALAPLDKAGTLIEREARASQLATNVAPDIYEDPLAPMNGSGNTVNMDKEQTEIAKNTIAYETGIELLRHKLSMQKLVLGEGR